MKTSRLSLYTAFATLIFCLSPAFYSFAQAPDWLWAKSAGGSDYDYGYSVATDANGNVLVTGEFRSSTLTFETTTLTKGLLQNIR